MNSREYPMDKLFEAELISCEAGEFNHNEVLTGGGWEQIACSLSFLSKKILPIIWMTDNPKRLVKRSNIYMEETSPKNPFGPNY